IAALHSVGEHVNFAVVDSDHSRNQVDKETQILLSHPNITVKAHDTSVQSEPFDHCDGPMLLKNRFQAAGYYCLEDNAKRPNEWTWRGTFFATRSASVVQVAVHPFAKWCDFTQADIAISLHVQA